MGPPKSNGSSPHVEPDILHDPLSVKPIYLLMTEGKHIEIHVTMLPMLMIVIAHYYPHYIL